MSDPATILENPKWFPYEFDTEFNSVTFVETSADALRTAPFLDQRFLTSGMGRRQFSVSEIDKALEGVDISPVPIIFHSAFCCSTLMASALDNPGTCLALKEPQILMSLANAKRILSQQNQPASHYKTRFDIVMKLLARRFHPKEQIILKPTNSVNNIVEDAHAADFPITVMYASLEDFLISVLKKGEPCKSFIRTQFNIFTLDKCVLATIPQRQAFTFTDLQIATLVWRHQIELFFKLKATQNETIVIRDKAFLDNKFDSLRSVANGLKLNLSDSALKQISEGPVFQRNAKFSDQNMDGLQRDRDAKAIKERYADELASTLKWAATVRLEGDVFA